MQLLLALLSCASPPPSSGTTTPTTPTDTDTPTTPTTPTDTDTPTTPTDTGTPPPPPPPLQVYLLAGQSNMDGYAYVSGLPPSWRVAQPDVLLYWSGSPAWSALAPASYGSLYGVEYFGPEVSFGRAMADARPDHEIALIKHAVGGTDLASYWYPGATRDDPAQGEGYRVFLATADAALDELDAAGTEWELAGMIWMQGESDAFDPAQAEAYADNLSRFVARVREDFEAPALPFALGKIHCPTCTYGDTIRAGQDEVAATVSGVTAFETTDLPIFADNIHYDGSGMRTLGQRFAQSLLGQPLSPTPTPAFALSGSFSSAYTGNFFLGYIFTVDRPITVTDLGTLDIGLDGLSLSSEVVIYDADSSTILARATVPAQASAPASPWDRWRYAALEPVDLEPGRYLVASQVYSGSPDRYIHNAAITAAEGFAWVESRHKDYASVGLPTIVSGGEASWFGPNLLVLER